ncbi:MAG: sensor histidine kinase [Myxococcota bacterium]
MHEELDALPIAVIRLTDEGRVDYVNSRAAELVQQAGVPLDGATLARTMSGLEQPAGARLEEDEGRPRLLVEGAEGTRVFGFQATRLASGDRLIAFQDITHIEQTQRERNRLLQLASISEVMPAVLHELKNPLASIAMAMELLIEDSPGEQRERLHAILGEVRRLSLTLDGLGRFRHEVRSARHHAIDLSLREAFALLEPQAHARGILTELKVRDMPLLPFEPAALRAVLFNLVTNSIHACQSGQRIEVSAWFDREASAMTLVVADTGAGMSHEVRERCTELFFTTKPRGSGIGLALCAGVADAVGGSMTVESQPGVGTKITLVLPITPRRS